MRQTRTKRLAFKVQLIFLIFDSAFAGLSGVRGVTEAPLFAHRKVATYNAARYADLGPREEVNKELSISEVDISNSVSSWVLIGLAIAFALAFVLTAKSWREASRSPYYFQRRQALQQMQNYSIVSLALLMATAAVLAYAWSPSLSTAPRTALLTNAKPISLDNLRSITTAIEEDATPSVIVRRAAPSIPSQFDTLEPALVTSEDTAIENVIFASGINDNYEPIGARSVFGEGDFTLFATFDYVDMGDGMTWAWVWRKDGELVSGGEQEWLYGENGPGYVYLEPEDGFAAGDYTLELYVNGELQTLSDLEVAVGVANR